MLALSPVTSRKIEDELTKGRTKLRQEIEEIFKSATQCIPVPLWDLTVREFLQLQTLLEEAASYVPDSDASAKTATKTSYELTKESRRVTRSMAAKTIQIGDSLAADGDIAGPVPSTPKFHPGLPETPAIVRRGRDVSSKSKTSNVFMADESTVKGKRGRPSTIRVTRSTIRASTVGATASKHSTTLDGNNNSRVSNVGGIVSVELDDGKCFDVDLMDSPSKLAANLGKDAIKEMKDKMQAYAQQLKSFFKRLKVIDK